MMDERITILTVINRINERFIKECWESIKKQTWKNWEWFILVDGNTEVYEFLNKVMPKSDKIIIHKYKKRTLGIGEPSNTVLHLAHPYIAVQDIDDVMVPDRLEKQIIYLKTHPEVTIVGGQIIIFRDITKEFCGTTNHPPVIDAKQIYQEALNGSVSWFMNHPTAMYKRDDILAIGGYDIDEYRATDIGLWLKALAAGYVLHNLPDVLVFYRQHDHQATKSNKFLDRTYHYMEYIRQRFIREMEQKCLKIQNAC